MMRFILLTAVAAMTVTSWAAKNQELKILITHGEQTSEFKFEPKSRLMEYSDSHGLKRSRKISAENYKFVMDKAKELPSPERLPFECGRARMSVVFGSGKTAKAKTSCFGMKSITSQKYEQLANLLAVEI